MTGLSRQVVAIVQARYGSSRLPGKVLEPIAGQPMLLRVLERAGRIKGVDQVALATTEAGEDDELVALADRAGVSNSRGHATDVLDRYYQTAQELEADVIVRITGDCPLLDPEVSAQTLAVFLQAEPPLDFAANRLPDHRTYPIGLDTEVCSLAALETAWTEADEPHQREHVMPFLYENGERFRIKLVDASGDWGGLRWTVDTAADLDFVRAVYAEFAPRTSFNWKEVLALLERKPELLEINQDVQHRELADVDPRFRPAKGS